MRKRIVCILLVCCMLFTMLPISVQAESFEPIWPTDSFYVSTLYYYNTYNNGSRHSSTYYDKAIDIGTETGKGKNIYAIEDGTVTAAGWSSGGLGYRIWIEHDNGKSIYGHLKTGSLKVSTGDKVKKGQIIAQMGGTGGRNQPEGTVSYSTHLHFEYSGEDLWDTRWKYQYYDKITLNTDCFYANERRYNEDPKSKNLIDWMNAYYIKSGGVYKYNRDVAPSGGSTPPDPFGWTTINVAVSSTAATSSNLPAAASRFSKDKPIYFNGNISGASISKAELYITPPYGKEQLVDIVSSVGSYFWLGSGSTGYLPPLVGDYQYRIRVYSGAYKKDFTGTFTVTDTSVVTPTDKNPFDSANVTVNASASKATSSSLPASASSFKQGTQVYFNGSLSGITVTKGELYITPPGGSETKVDSISGSYNTHFWLGSGTTGYTLSANGTYQYRVRLYSGSYSKDYTGSITASGTNPFDSANITVNTSSTKATSGNLPAASTSFAQNSIVYVNGKLNGTTVTAGELYITPPDGSESKVDSFSGSYDTSFWLGSGTTGYSASKAGTYTYRVRLYSGSYSKDFTGNFSVTAAQIPSTGITVNVSATKATSSSLPSAATSFAQGSTVYFNGDLNGFAITSAELYITPPGGSEAKVDSMGACSSYFWLGSGTNGYSLTQSGTYSYRVRIYSNSSTKDFTGSFTSTANNPFNNASIMVSTSGTKATSSSLPSAATSFAKGSSVYVNGKISGITVTKGELYITPPGGSETKVDSMGACSSYFWLGNGTGGYALTQAGTYTYRVRLYSGDYSKDYTGSIVSTGASSSPFDSAAITVSASTIKATSSSLPSGATNFATGTTVFFNGSVSGITLSTVELYITPPGGVESRVDSTSSISSYFWLGSGAGGYTLSQSGTYAYRIHAVSGGSAKDFRGTLSVSAGSQNVSISTSTVQATSSSLPGGATSFPKGSVVFFNGSISGTTITSGALYITPPGGTETMVDSISGRYSSYFWLGSGTTGYALSNAGTYNYRISLTSAGGTTDYRGTILSTAAVSGISLTQTSLSIEKGSTAALTAVVSPSDATNKTVTWYSTNTNVATVSNTGVVAAVAPGSAVIVATTVDGGKTATCSVTVPNPTYIITFSANGGSGSMSSVSVTNGATYTVPVCGFTAPAGKHFSAWDIGGRQYYPKDVITVNSNVTISAVWKDNPTVTFSANGGSGTMSSINIKPGTYQLPDCSFTAPAETQFKAWDIGGKQFLPGETITVSSDITVSAVWEPIPTINKTVTFVANGGSGTMSSIKVEPGSYTLPVCAFTAPAGKRFAIWDVEGKQYLPGTTVTVSSNVTVTAIWEEIPTVYVSFDANGGSGTMQDITLSSTSYTLPDCEFVAPAGKKFQMWNVEGKQYLPGEELIVMDNVTVTAIWEDLPIEYRTITYDANGGSGIMGSERVPVGAFTLPACEYSPQAGLYFKAWRINGVDYAAGATCYEEGDLILTAIWESETGWYYPMKNAYHTWGYENSWGASCEEYGRYNEGDRNYHIAIDLNSDFDPNIYACYQGVVKKTGWNGANGYYVILEHQIEGKTIYSFYSHLEEISVADGTTVSGWDKIGVVGKTGSAAGEEIHVHFALVDSYSSNGGYWGYATEFSGDITNYGGMTFYNPVYVIENGKLPTYDAFAGRTIRYNISDAKVSQNASAGDLPVAPDSVTVGDAYYLNIQIDNGTALDKVELYMTAPGESEAKIQTDQGPIRYCYSDNKYVFSKEGTYTFRWVLYIGSDTKVISDNVTCVAESGTEIQGILVSDSIVTAYVQGYDPDATVFCASYTTDVEWCYFLRLLSMKQQANMCLMWMEQNSPM